MLAHVAGSTRESPYVRGRPVFRAVARHNLSDEKRVSRISSGDFQGPGKIYCIRVIERISVRPWQYSFSPSSLSRAHISDRLACGDANGLLNSNECNFIKRFELMNEDSGNWTRTILLNVINVRVHVLYSLLLSRCVHGLTQERNVHMVTELRQSSKRETFVRVKELSRRRRHPHHFHLNPCPWWKFLLRETADYSALNET